MNKEAILETAIACGIGAVQARRLIVEVTGQQIKSGLKKVGKVAGIAGIGAAAGGAIGHDVGFARGYEKGKEVGVQRGILIKGKDLNPDEKAKLEAKIQQGEKEAHEMTIAGKASEVAHTAADKISDVAHAVKEKITDVIGNTEKTTETQ